MHIDPEFVGVQRIYILGKEKKKTNGEEDDPSRVPGAYRTHCFVDYM